jgi:hypothetical protein
MRLRIVPETVLFAEMVPAIGFFPEVLPETVLVALICAAEILLIARTLPETVLVALIVPGRIAPGPAICRTAV